MKGSEIIISKCWRSNNSKSRFFLFYSGVLSIVYTGQNYFTLGKMRFDRCIQSSNLYYSQNIEWFPHENEHLVAIHAVLAFCVHSLIKSHAQSCETQSQLFECKGWHPNIAGLILSFHLLIAAWYCLVKSYINNFTKHEAAFNGQSITYPCHIHQEVLK